MRRATGAVRAVAREVAHGIMFHHFHDARHPKVQGSILPSEFEGLLQRVGLHRILSPEEWLERLEQGRLGPDDLCLTFDDGLRCQFDVALPVLRRYGLTAFWFVYSSVFEGQRSMLEIYRRFRTTCFPAVDDFYAKFFGKVGASRWAERAAAALEAAEVARWRAWYPFYSENDVKFRFIRDRALPSAAYEQLMDELIQEHGVTVAELAKDLWMTNKQLRELSRGGHVIGLHSYSHPTNLAALSVEAQSEEYVKNARHLAAVCGEAPVAMAHPCNAYDGRTLDILRRLGIRCGFRANLAAPGADGQLNPTRLELAREDHVNVMRMLAPPQEDQ